MAIPASGALTFVHPNIKSSFLKLKTNIAFYLLLNLKTNNAKYQKYQ